MGVFFFFNLLMLKHPVEGADDSGFLAVGVLAKVAVFIKSCLIVESTLCFWSSVPSDIISQAYFGLVAAKTQGYFGSFQV
ncbi:hypothetical protein Peur_050728 [Populus x canadensis]